MCILYFSQCRKCQTEWHTSECHSLGRNAEDFRLWSATQNACLTTAVNSWLEPHAFLTPFRPALCRPASRVSSPSSATLLRLFFLVSRRHAFVGVFLYLGDQSVPKIQATSHSPCTTSLLAPPSHCHVHEHQGRLSVSNPFPAHAMPIPSLTRYLIDSDRRIPLSNGRVERLLSHSLRTYKLFNCDPLS